MSQGDISEQDALVVRPGLETTAEERAQIAKFCDDCLQSDMIGWLTGHTSRLLRDFWRLDHALTEIAQQLQRGKPRHGIEEYIRNIRK